MGCQAASSKNGESCGAIAKQRSSLLSPHPGGKIYGPSMFVSFLCLLGRGCFVRRW